MSKIKRTGLTLFFSPFPVAFLRSKITTSGKGARKRGQNKGDRCLMKRMGNLEAPGEEAGLGNPADLGLSPGLPLSSCRAWPIKPPKSLWSNAMVISHIWLFKVIFKFINI